MAMDFSDIFAQYEAVVASVDKAFESVRDACGPAVACAKGCSDCCNAVFDLSLVEAMYINDRFAKAFADKPAEREAIMRRAEEAERQQVKLVRQAQRKAQQGAEAEAILSEMAGKRIRCPLLSTADGCELYAARPITCRLYGIPQNIAGEVHTCGLSGFEPGQTYPTVKIEKIQDALVELSMAIMGRLKTKFSGLHTTHMPLATAIMNTFDDEYLGVKKDDMALAEEPEDAFNAASPFAPAPGSQPSGGCGCGGSCAPSPGGSCGCSPKQAKDTGGCEGNPIIIEIPGAD